MKFGHRQANMVQKSGAGVFEFARKIKGLAGVELQVYFQGSTLCDRATVLDYRRAAEQFGLKIPSLAGIWPSGASILQPARAEEHIRNAIHAAEQLKASVILAACFERNCPNMDQEQSYGPVVALLQKVSQSAEDAGVTVGMETSLSPADDKKLIDLVDTPSVKVYYDIDNVESFGHTGQSVLGIDILGNTRIRQVHLKNEDRLLEQSGRVDWAAAVKALAKIAYGGWFMFETSHPSPDQCVEATERNIDFIERHFFA